MSDNHPPYGGYPDPNAGAWGNQPDPNAPYGAQPGSGAPYGAQPASGAPYGAQPASGAPYGTPPGSGAPYGAQPAAPYPGQPAAPGGYPGQPAPFAPVPPKRGMTKGLIVGLVAGAVTLTLLCCGGGLAYVAFGGDEDDPKPVASGSATPGPGTPTAAPSESGPASTGPDEPSNNDALTARYSSEMSAVCEGGAILNAAAYTGPSSAKAFVFSNAPDRPTFWSQKSFSSDKSYYTKSADFATASVIGCLKVVEGSEGTPKKCQYKNTDGKVVTVNYISSRYTLTFHAAKTGEKIGDGGTVTAPASRCPSFISYNKVTLKSYAAPDSGTIEAALDRFLK
ncbi:hypothetical protein GA0070622_3117 [Micromonospora sediminicola]|uniref:Uncharacterized protein n=1 Tax=Micromonospora sediminicola TaxID=946078 RepID=A0A1A9B9A4_9ACTN|nr:MULTISPECIES: hypothetical protein [Micromonospora]PGH44353.1 hypothetical protein COO58_07875 [Micromonospora sp. WMMA1996]SBT66100.1 hypothetical protein GA0070622_3117 [Micromonospora sediminicola]